MANLQPLHALNLDQSQQQAFVRYLKSLPEKPNTTVRFFNRIDYYTLHGEDAQLAAMEVFKSTASIKIMGSEPNKMKYIVLSKTNFEIFVRELLLIKLYRVEVYSNQGTLKSNDWMLEFKGSPGNLSQFEDILYSNAEVVVNSTIIAVDFAGDEKNKMVGIICVDTSERIFSIAEFPDDEHFSELEALVVQLGPKECLLRTSDTAEIKAITSIMERTNVSITPRKKSEFTTDGLVQDLNRLLTFAEGQQKDANTLQETSLTRACSCLNAALRYLELTSEPANFNAYSFKRLDSRRFVHLDSAALNALNVLPKKNGTMDSNKTHCILGLLDRCRTAHGKRLISQWVRQPLRDLNRIEERLDIVEALTIHNDVRRQLHEDHMRRIPDLQMLTKRLSRKKANLQDCYKIFQAMERVPFLLDCIKQCDDKSVNGAFVSPIADLLVDMEKYQQMIQSTIDMDLVDRGEFLVRPSFDEELKVLRDQMDDIESTMKKELNKTARDINLEAGKSIKMDWTSIHGHHFRITLKDEPVIRKNKQLKILDAVKGGVRFQSEKLERLNEEYSSVKKSYEEYQKNVVVEIIKIAAGYSDILWAMSVLLARLDILLSFSVVACEAPTAYIRPQMLAPSGEAHLTLTDIRHPCLELQDGISYIANDVHFKQEEDTFRIITGPNMGGKSTYIRSVGVSVLMAHLGCFVPCSKATVPLVDCILARVGADDCESRGLSTFMLEMIEAAAILRTATKNSLVIIDELGRGTSTYEGCGIAWAIAEHLAKDTKAFCLFATHFHEITQLEHSVDRVSNWHVTAVTTLTNLTLLYKLQPGICDRSFGIHVAKMADFPDHVVKFAENKQAELESNRFDVENVNISDKASSKREAEEIILDFLRACSQLDSELPEQTINSKLDDLRKNIQHHNNPFIKYLLESG